MIDLGEWTMIMRGPKGDDYPIASGPLPASLLPDLDDDGNVVLTVEMASFIRSLADQVEQLCIQGDVPDATGTHKATDLYSPPEPGAPRR